MIIHYETLTFLLFSLYSIQSIYSTMQIEAENTSIRTKRQFDIGDRVILSTTKDAGTLRFVGRIASRRGVWAGVELDEKRGDNDGSIEG
jgi:hypothetical protein